MSVFFCYFSIIFIFMTQKRACFPLFARTRLNFVTEGEPDAHTRINSYLLSFDLWPRTCHLTNACIQNIFVVRPNSERPIQPLLILPANTRHARERERGTERQGNRVRSDYTQRISRKDISCYASLPTMARLIIRRVDPFTIMSKTDRMKIFLAYFSTLASVCMRAGSTLT